MLWRLSEKIISRKSIHLKSFLDIGQKYSFYQKMIFEHRPKTIIRGQKKTFFQKMNSEIWTRMDNLQYRRNAGNHCWTGRSQRGLTIFIMFWWNGSQSNIALKENWTFTKTHFLKKNKHTFLRVFWWKSWKTSSFYQKSWKNVFIRLFRTVFRCVFVNFVFFKT